MICCPKCASSEGQSIEALYKTPEEERPAIAAHLSRQSEPPEARHPRLWLALTIVFTVMSITTFGGTRETAALMLCGVLSAAMAREALTYNRLYLPRLLEYWHRSFICTRCGEVFVPV
ncbi:MAG TPA: hypothetical protein VJL35_04700 [Gemmatimonadaceae bacterium]|jgi:hypothetical protein|nr:hypothetical protein [Gemmatimonadaceae bacterium]